MHYGFFGGGSNVIGSAELVQRYLLSLAERFKDVGNSTPDGK